MKLKKRNLKAPAIFLACCLVLPVAFGQSIQLLPDTETTVEAGKQGFVQLSEASDTSAWRLLTPQREWLEWESEKVAQSEETAESGQVHIWQFRAMKPGACSLVFVKKGAAETDTATFSLHIAPWKSPLQSPAELQQQTVALNPAASTRLQPGESAFISQQENRNTPFFWVIKTQHPNLISIDRQQYFPPSADPDAPGIHAWRLRALQPGKTVVELQFVGPGKRGSKPVLETLSYVIEVGE